MAPEWLKQTAVYRGARNAVSVLERELLRMEYALLTDKARKEELVQQITQMPLSNGSRYYRKLPLRVGIVSDEFLFENYSSTCELIALTPENWKKLLPSLDCVIVTSVWHGLSGEWTGASVPGTEISELLCSKMLETQRQGCPVLFYSKEDPPNFCCFQKYAKFSNYIYTSARECVPKYQKMFPGVPVNTISFAISPTIHNPVGMKAFSGEKRVFFAGSWMKKYPKRVEEQKQLFEWIERVGFCLEIADRNYFRYSVHYRYPLQYLYAVLSNFSYRQIASLYKIHDWSLNFNSVSSSRDMFSMRVYDALACGALLLSNESVGMEEQFPQVFAIRTYKELWEALHLPRSALEQRRLEGIRQALRVGTVYERMETMLRGIGISASAAGNGTVGVLLWEEDHDKRRYMEMFTAQTYEKKRWISSCEDLDAIRSCDMIALWGPGRYYGAYYLEDMVNGFKYTNCDYVTKEISQEGSGFHLYTEEIADPCATVFWRDTYLEMAQKIRRGPCKRQNGYASDLDNYKILHPSDVQNAFAASGIT